MTPPRAEGSSTHVQVAVTEKARLPIKESAVAGIDKAVAVTRPPPPGDGHQQDTVVQIHSDSSTPKPPAETCFVPGFATSEGREAAASRGQISWICISDATQRSRQTEVCLAEKHVAQPVSYYHTPTVE